MTVARHFLLLLAACGGLAAQPKTLFYLNGSPAGIRSFEAHASKIDIVVPTVYSVDGDGLVWGEPDPRVLDTARRAGVAVMPIIVNRGFNQEIMHALLTGGPSPRARLFTSLVSECKKYGYYGIQFDFENVSYLDRGLLSALVADTAATLGRAGFKLSIATVPRDSDYAGGTDYSRWVFQNWRGAYDLKAIGAAVDFVSLMTYDQHTGSTPPGPVAGMPWVEALLAHAAAGMPKDKISLGIPLYGRRWHAGMRAEKEPAAAATSISAPDAADLARAMQVQPQWDATEHVPWFYFYRDGVREYVYYNDARSFRDRYGLARREGLHGVSSWVLGMEDPGLWDALPARGGAR